jgi:hypothetical protein
MPTDENYKNLEEIVDLGCSIGNALGKSLEDGELDASDLGDFFPVVVKVGPAISDFSKGIDAIKERLSAEEFQKLSQFVKDNFDIPEDTIEKAIEKSIDVVFAVYEIAKIFKK